VVDGVRGDKTNQLNSNIQREFRFKERYNLQARVDVINVFNRSQMDTPSTDPSNTNFGRVVAQTTAQNRFLQVQARFRF
jgi:outer membrane receptor protein involved in Fe transport